MLDKKLDGEFAEFQVRKGKKPIAVGLKRTKAKMDVTFYAPEPFAN